MNFLRKFLRSEEGPTATEYAVLLGLIVVAALAAVTELGSTVSGIFKKTGTKIQKLT